MADVERESKNSDQIQETDTPEEDNRKRTHKKVCKINNKKQKKKRISTSTSSSSMRIFKKIYHFKSG